MWKETTNNKLKIYAPGNTGRPGQNKMPAMTIPWKIHRKLRTTIDSGFRNEIKELCDNDEITIVLKKIINDQITNGLSIDDTDAGRLYKKGWITMLDGFKEMKILTQSQKNDIVEFLK